MISFEATHKVIPSKGAPYNVMLDGARAYTEAEWNLELSADLECGTLGWTFLGDNYGGRIEAIEGRKHDD